MALIATCGPVWAQCVPDPSGCPTIIADRGASCSCSGTPPATCPDLDGVLLEWRRPADAGWTLAAALPCYGPFVDTCGAITPRACRGLDVPVPLVRWLPSLPAGTTVWVRFRSYRVTPEGVTVVSCAQPAGLSLCWPFVREWP